MSNQLTFKEVIEKNSKTLDLYVPIVARVHGDTHPEFHKVHALFDTINGKIEAAGANKPDLKEEFAGLGEITNGYTIPEDTCESYETVYNLLAEADKAYHA